MFWGKSFPQPNTHISRNPKETDTHSEWECGQKRGPSRKVKAGSGKPQGEKQPQGQCKGAALTRPGLPDGGVEGTPDPSWLVGNVPQPTSLLDNLKGPRAGESVEWSWESTNPH